MRILKAGHHFLNSISQFSMTLVGTTIKCGPQIPEMYYTTLAIQSKYCFIENKLGKKGRVIHTQSIYSQYACTIYSNQLCCLFFGQYWCILNQYHTFFLVMCAQGILKQIWLQNINFIFLDCPQSSRPNDIRSKNDEKLVLLLKSEVLYMYIF